MINGGRSVVVRRGTQRGLGHRSPRMMHTLKATEASHPMQKRRTRRYPQYREALALARKRTPSAQLRALSLLESGAKQGDPRCEYALGTWYLFGVCVRKNFARAADLFEAAAASGNTDAQFYLAICYERGRGRKRDVRRASDRKSTR